MSLLLETIKVKNSNLQNIEFHNQRLNFSRERLFSANQKLDLESEIQIPSDLKDGISKCRVLYRDKIEKIEFHPYQIKLVKTLQIVYSDRIDYPYKFADRTSLESLKTGIVADDILIVKNGLISDTSYANIVFFDGRDWITPATPLLKGTKRSQLLQQQKIRAEIITIDDLQKFQYAKLINAMIDLEESPVIETFIHYR
ncbi:aminotransferase class IV [Tumidithrix elongata RA019]|uniref:Aminotransferase class IV n=1 Tax=Tumidithrix elongata BACA0141 TaxID=2716417 RepID=A0AAW9PYL1_9CYAN|nr:aminotransferase class IV [Tumidithrix elongata RA019]